MRVSIVDYGVGNLHSLAWGALGGELEDRGVVGEEPDFGDERDF